MQKYASVVQDKTGRAIKGASVLVKKSDNSSATIYSDNGGTVIPGATMTTDGFGGFAFYAADGRYNIYVTVNSNPVGQLLDVLLEDPADGSPIAIVGGSVTNSAITGGTMSGTALSAITIDGVAVTGTDIAKYSRLDDADGASVVVVTQSGSGATSRTVQTELRETVKVSQFLPASFVTDGSVDYTTDILEAMARAGTNGQLEWPENTTLLVTQKLTLPQGQKWIFHGGRRAATLKKGFNGDMVEMGALSVITGANMDGNGATFTGRGIYIASGGSQVIDDVRITQTEGVCLEFASAQGGGASVSRLIADNINPTVVAAVKIAGDSGPNPRFFNNIWLSGGLFELGAGAGNGCSITNFYVRNFIFTGPVVGGSALFHIANGRVASIGDTTTVSGSDITFVGVAFSGAVALLNAQGMRFSACTFGTGITEDAATCNSNDYSTGENAYTVVWDQASGIQPAIGNGTLTGFYSRGGRRALVNLRLVVGSTTTFGNSAVGYRLSLPFPGATGLNQRGMYLNVFDASASTDFPCTATVPAGLSTFTMSRNGAGVRDGFPIAWATGDIIDIQFEYMLK